MTTTWPTRLVDLRHRRVIHDNSLTLTLYVEKKVDGVVTAWNPWTSPDSVVTGAEIPVPGDRIGDFDTAAWASILGTFASWADDYRVREIDWQMVGGSMSMWSCTISCSSHVTYCPEPLIIRSDSMRTRTVDRWRDATPTTSTADGATISGTAYTEVSGVPEKFQVSQIAINLTLPWFSDTTVYADGYPNLANLIGAKVGKVNSASFIGFEANSLMLMGVDVDPKQDEYLQVTVSLLWDGWFHMDQVIDRYPNGDPKLTTGQATTVKWQKRYQGTTDLGTMFSADEKLYAQYGWQAFTQVCGTFQSSAYATTKKEPLPSVRTAAT